jgi:hypothetical protein
LAPYAVIEFYQGRRSLDSTHEAATKPDEKCEAAFYAGEWQLLRGNKLDARRALQTARRHMPENVLRIQRAVAERKRLGK